MVPTCPIYVLCRMHYILGKVIKRWLGTSYEDLSARVHQEHRRPTRWHYLCRSLGHWLQVTPDIILPLVARKLTLLRRFARRRNEFAQNSYPEPQGIPNEQNLDAEWTLKRKSSSPSPSPARVPHRKRNKVSPPLFNKTTLCLLSLPRLMLCVIRNVTWSVVRPAGIHI